MAKERVIIDDPETEKLRLGALDPKTGIIRLSDQREYSTDQVAWGYPLTPEESEELLRDGQQ